MQLSHPVDAVRTDGGQVCHSHGPGTGFVNQRHTAYALPVMGEARAYFLKEPMVDGIDYLQMSRQEAGEKGYRPSLQRLGQEGMVGVGESILRNLPRGIPVHQVFVNEQSHHFGDSNGRVGVV